MKAADGSVLRWTPPEPKIGDLVCVEALLPSSGTGSTGSSATGASADAPVLQGPDAVSIDPLSGTFVPAGEKIVWSFRVTKPGDWTWKSGEKAEKLWMAATVAGNENEPKKLDAESLWKGTWKKSAKPASGLQAVPGANTPGQVAPGNASPVAPAAPIQQSAPQQSAPQSLPVPAQKAVQL